MSADGQGTKWRRNIAENFNRLTRMHERYRQTTRQTDGPAIAYSEREREFTFAKKLTKFGSFAGSQSKYTDPLSQLNKRKISMRQ